MQFLPNLFSANAAGSFAGLGASAATPAVTAALKVTASGDLTGGDGFARQFELASKATGKGVQAATGSARESLQSLKLTAEDLDALSEDLAAAGLTPAQLTALKEAVASPQGLSWSDFLGKLGDSLGVDDPVTLLPRMQEADKTQLRSLLQKLGCTDDEATSLLADFASGDVSRVSEALATMQAKADQARLEGRSMNVRPEELSALGRAVGLTKGDLRSFMSLADQAAAGGSPQALDAALSTLANAVEKQLRAQQKTAEASAAGDSGEPGSGDAAATKAVDDALKGALSRALAASTARSEREASASNRESAEVARMKTRVRDAVLHGQATDKVEAEEGRSTAEAGAKDASGLKVSRTGLEQGAEQISPAKAAEKMLKEAADARAGAQTTAEQAKAAETARKGEKAEASPIHVGKVASEDEAAQAATGKRLVFTEQQAEANAKTKDAGPSVKHADAMDPKDPRAAWTDAARATAGQESGKDGGSAGRDFSSGEEAAKSAAAKKATELGAKETGTSFLADVLAERGAETSAKADGSSRTTARQADIDREKVLDQVRQGILKDLGQGKKELTLRLDPPELGKVHVTLQVVGKEVNAVLRTDNHESARALSDQMSSLRASLEAQGLKVQNVEVQTQLSDSGNDSGNSWLGANGHNLAREGRERAREEAERGLLRKMGRGGNALARSLQSQGADDPGAAITAQPDGGRTGLYLIA